MTSAERSSGTGVRGFGMSAIRAAFGRIHWAIIDIKPGNFRWSQQACCEPRWLYRPDGQANPMPPRAQKGDPLRAPPTLLRLAWAPGGPCRGASRPTAPAAPLGRLG